jgi:hypothetical protein
LPRRPQEALLCAKAKRQQLFYLCESVATATATTTTTKRPVGMEFTPSFWRRAINMLELKVPQHS